MNLSKPRPPDHEHEDVFALLPWHITGTLENKEHARVEAHLSRCPICRCERAKLYALSERISRTPCPDLDPQAGYSRLLATVRQRERSESAALRLGRFGRLRTRLRHLPVMASKPLARMALAIVLLLLIVPLSWHQWDRLTEPRFRTLADPSSIAALNQGDLRLVVEPGLGAERVDALLKAVDGSRVDMPGSAGVYTVRLAGGKDKHARIEAALTYLRRQPGVLLAEPTTGPPASP
jgi:anti-sigma factor RsiW